MRSPGGELLADVRKATGTSQATLAARAGTTQSAISRIESGNTSPSIRSLERLLALMGHRLVLASEPVEDGIDRSLIRANLALDDDVRVRRGLDFAEVVRRNRGAAST